MNELKKTISDIKLLVDSNDLSNTPHSRALAERYRQCIIEFNELAEQCQKLMERNMIIEAEQLASTEPKSLYEQQRVLNFEQKEEFEELFKMYDWPELPAMRVEILTALTVAASDVSDLLPLLDAYRKIARSNEDKRKIALLRKIAELDKGKPEWLDTLKSLEEKRIAVLTDEAKNAILNKEYDKLESVQEELNSGAWRVSVNPMVSKKIASVLQEKYAADAKAQAEKYIEIINLAYGAQDYDGLARSIKKWQNFVTRNCYVPTPEQQAQFQEAEQYYLEQKSEHDRVFFISSLLNQLRSGIEKQENFQELAYIYNQLKSNDAEIPEELERQFFEYYTAAEAAARKKIYLIGAAAVVGAIILIALVVWLISSFTLRRLEDQWHSEIEGALKENPSAVALDLLKQAKEKAPRVAKSSRILKLEKDALQKQEQEKRNRQEFRMLAAEQVTLLKDFVRNAETIKSNRDRMRALIVDQQEESIFQRHEADFKRAMDAYNQQRERMYEDIIEQVKKESRLFYVALREKNYKAAEDSLEKIDNCKNQAERLRDVDTNIQIRGRRVLDATVGMTERLNKERREYDQFLSALKSVYESTSPELLLQCINEVLEKYPRNDEIGKLKNLKASLTDIPRFSLDNTTNSVFVADYAKQKQMSEHNQRIVKGTQNIFAKLHDLYNRKTMGSVIVASEGELYDFYYFKRQSPNIPSMARCTIGNNQFQHFSFNKNNDHMTVALATRGSLPKIDGKESVSGELFYPPREESAKPHADLAPHIKFVNRKYKELQTQNSEQPWENVIKDIFSACLNDKYIAPQMKLTFLQMICKIILKEYPEHDVYKPLSDQFDKIKAGLGADYSWLQSYNFKEIHRQFQYELKKVNEETVFPTAQKNVFYRELFDFVLKRKIVPAGYCVVNNGQSLLYGNFAARHTGELWQVSEKPPYFRIVGRYQGNRIELQENVMLSPFQLLYTPEDDQDTAEMVRQFKTKAAVAKIKKIEWPVAWPAVQE